MLFRALKPLKDERIAVFLVTFISYAHKRICPIAGRTRRTNNALHGTRTKMRRREKLFPGHWEYPYWPIRCPSSSYLGADVISRLCLNTDFQYQQGKGQGCLLANFFAACFTQFSKTCYVIATCFCISETSIKYLLSPNIFREFSHLWFFLRQLHMQGSHINWKTWKFLVPFSSHGKIMKLAKIMAKSCNFDVWKYSALFSLQLMYSTKALATVNGFGFS